MAIVRLVESAGPEESWGLVMVGFRVVFVGPGRHRSSLGLPRVGRSTLSRHCDVVYVISLSLPCMQILHAPSQTWYYVASRGKNTLFASCDAHIYIVLVRGP